jgi:hypothetical protein
MKSYRTDLQYNTFGLKMKERSNIYSADQQGWWSGRNLWGKA